MNRMNKTDTLSNFINSIQESVDQNLAHDFMTVREVSKELNAHPNTVYRTIKSGDLKAHNIGAGESGKNSYRISREALENYLANRVAQLM